MLIMFVNSAAVLGGAGQAIEMALSDLFGSNGSVIWSIIVAITAAAILLSGTYSLLEKMRIALVASFTVVTVICTMLLQWTGYAVTWASIQEGISFSLPPTLSTIVTLTALAMFSGTGVSFSEMWTYTYWCAEKGYARRIGASQPGAEWAQRAQGWIRVMYVDVFLTMALYTASTVCFYLLGCDFFSQRNWILTGCRRSPWSARLIRKVWEVGPQRCLWSVHFLFCSRPFLQRQPVCRG